MEAPAPDLIVLLPRVQRPPATASKSATDAPVRADEATTSVIASRLQPVAGVEDNADALDDLRVGDVLNGAAGVGTTLPPRRC